MLTAPLVQGSIGIRTSLWIIAVLMILAALSLTGCSSGGITGDNGTAAGSRLPPAGSNLTNDNLYDYDRLHWCTMSMVEREGSHGTFTDYRFEISREVYNGTPVMHVRINRSKDDGIVMNDDYYDLATGDRLFERTTDLSPGRDPWMNNDTTVYRNYARGNYYLTPGLRSISLPPAGRETMFINGRLYDCEKFMASNSGGTANGGMARPSSFAVWIVPDVPAPVKIETVDGSYTRTFELTGWG